ncbi:MAG: hypothetical protein ABI634_02815 [Acidobacteriota bacterium]
MSDAFTIDRRGFLRTGLAAGAFVPFLYDGSAAAIALVVDPADPVATASPSTWALGELRRALAAAGHAVRQIQRVDQAAAADTCIVSCGASTAVAASAFTQARVSMDAGPEQLALISARVGGRPVVLATGSDPRGLTYALLELADRIAAPGTTAQALALPAPIVERPLNPVRSVMRQFVSEPLDKPWFNDREMWPAYLTMLAGHRFNRLHLAFGLGYDTLQSVTDSYFVFMYPFLVDVPGHSVRVTNVSASERDRNLDTMRFISEQTVARGLVFQLGLWMHGYELINSPRAKYVVEGLTAANHAAYCRDGLTAVLRACPAISSVALRIHGESGVAEGSYDFWFTVFDGVRRAGRPIEIDLHAKGVDQKMIDGAVATGMPVNVSPKYWAEHLGMPYHQAAIRDLEMPAPGQTGRGLMTLSEGSRSFTRYGYADLLRDDRKYTVRHRVFAGTQRLLMAGDPRGTAAYARVFPFCGSTGVDLMEPLTCRGRRGTGIEGTRRTGYADASLEPQYDWQKYAYWYRTWGRLTFNADADAGQWRRHFAGIADARPLESALAQASRILPIVTTAHLPSAACDAYWPEIYWNQPMAAEPRPNPYGDSPAPRVFQTVSPLDPQLFSRITDYVDEMLKGESSGRYSPIEVAQWLEDLTASVTRDLAQVKAGRSAETRRLVVDAQIQAGLGTFFAAKLRAGVLFAIYQRALSRRALDEALAMYRRARQAWAELAAVAGPAYAADLSVSDKISERGQWIDRLAAIDADITQVAQRDAFGELDPKAEAAVATALAHPRRPPPPCRHTSPATFTAGSALALKVTLTQPARATGATCYYRHVNQADRFEQVAMTRAGADVLATIPAAYTDSPYPLQYYVVIHEGPATAHLFPGLGPDHMSQPYVVVRRRS